MRPHHSSSMHLGGYPPPPQLGPRHGSMPYEGSSNGYPVPSSSRHPSGSSSYYYSSSARPPYNPLSNSAAPSPGGHSYRTNPSVEHYPPPQHTATMMGRRTNSLGPSPHVEVDPSYHVEHLATFAVGRQFGLQNAQDGIRKLKHMEKQSAIWAQPLILKLLRDKISVEDDNGEIVEQFQMRLIENPTAHQSQDRSETYNNILLFTVRGDDRHPHGTPTEMHIFHCIGVSAKDVAQDIHYYTRGQINKVKGGRRDVSGYIPSYEHSNYGPIPQQQNYYRDDASPSSNSSETIDVNVNTLNRCFDDIEKFVARIQSAALAQRELDMQRMRTRTKQRGKDMQPPPGILQLRAQMPTQSEFFEIFQKFKLSFNILTMVKDYIHDPNAPELLHFLFTPLIVILDACHWGLGHPVAPQVVSPLLTFDAIELLRNCLTSKEFDVWMSLGPNWRTPPEEYRGPLPPPYRPAFRDSGVPYGYPSEPSPQTHTMHRGSSAPPPQHHSSSRQPQRAVDDLELERVNLEKERIAFERMKLLERERYLEEQEQRMFKEQSRLEAERKLLEKEALKHQQRSTDNLYARTSPTFGNGAVKSSDNNLNPQMRSFLKDLLKHNRKIVEVTYDRVKQHDKELTVMRGEYLEVLLDEKNWWECRNYQNVVGFVPHTILSVLTPEDVKTILNAGNGIIDPSQIPQHNPPAQSRIPHPPPLPSESSRTNVLDTMKKLIDKKLENGTTTSSKIEAFKRANRPEELPYITDLFDTINGKKNLLPRRQPSNRGKLINYKSTIPEIQAWLKEKRFSPKILTLFSKFNGQDMFMISKEELEKHCGDEGKRLYSLLLVQKKRSQFDSFSNSDPMLKAILHKRKIEVEKQNEAADEPIEDPPAITHPINNNIEIKTTKNDDVIKPIIPPSSNIKMTSPILPKKTKTKPLVVPRTTAKPYQPARLASPPETDRDKDMWIQTVKIYN